MPKGKPKKQQGAGRKQPIRNQPGGQHEDQPTGQSGTCNSTPRGFCYKYDQKGSCPADPCKYKHLCTNCGKKGHSKQKCRSQSQSSPTDTSKD